MIKEKIYNHKNSSALLIHLMNKHPAVYKQCKEDDDKERKDRENQKKEMEHQVKLGKSSQGHTSASQVLFSGQGGPIDKFLKTGTHLPLPYWKQKRIDKKYALWLGGSGLPISAVTDDPNFRGFVAELNPEARLPSRFKVGKDCEQLSEEVQNKIKDALENAKMISITVDIWSSTKCKNSYLGVTAHMFNHSTFRRENYRIACRKFDVAHTGENIAKMIHLIMTEYGIESKVFYCLSDNGSNMKKGLRLMEECSDILNESFDDNCWNVWEERFEAGEINFEEGTNEGDESGSDVETENIEFEAAIREEEEILTYQNNLEVEHDEHRDSFQNVGLRGSVPE